MNPASTKKGNPSCQTDDSNIPAPFRLSTYYYDLPERLIAQAPSPVRDDSLLMVLHRGTGEIHHRAFKDLPNLLRPSDLLVVNETRVIPVSLSGRKASGGRVELLVLNPAHRSRNWSSETLACRVCLTKSSKPIRPGTRILLDNGPELAAGDTIAPGRVQTTFPVPEDDLIEFLERYGSPPLPPYISSANRDRDRDRSRYQTVYAKIAGSVAAPTAGLHFTEELLQDLARQGIQTARILLHVGPGTFIPVRSEDVRAHKMEPEFCEIPAQAAESIQQALDEERRVIAVGTTTVRALESAAMAGKLTPGRGETDLFITPGYSFKVINGLVTNFHLPGSTLLMLVCAFAGIDFVMKAYEAAVRDEYRFFSYGDACLILGNH